MVPGFAGVMVPLPATLPKKPPPLATVSTSLADMVRTPRTLIAAQLLFPAVATLAPATITTESVEIGAIPPTHVVPVPQEPPEAVLTTVAAVLTLVLN